MYNVYTSYPTGFRSKSIFQAFEYICIMLTDTLSEFNMSNNIGSPKFII